MMWPYPNFLCKKLEKKKNQKHENRCEETKTTKNGFESEDGPISVELRGPHAV